MNLQRNTSVKTEKDQSTHACVGSICDGRRKGKGRKNNNLKLLVEIIFTSVLTLAHIPRPHREGTQATSNFILGCL